MLAGIACGVAAALIALPSLLIFDSFNGQTDWLGSFMALAETAYEDLDSNEAAIGLGSFLWMVMLAICAVPVIATALIGELGRFRSGLWYCGGSGVIAALMPWLARALLHLEEVKRVTPLEARLALLFFLSGATGGLVYWLVAGRRRPLQVRSRG